VLAQRYRILGKLGQGGMGEVYKAADLLLGQTVALKFLPENLAANPSAIERFRNEVRLARQVSHANVCRVYDMGEAEGQLFLTMEYVDGEDLASLLRRIGRLPGDKAAEIARRLCAGLAAAHEKGVLHRDFKPGNIMIDGRGQVRITDFGLAALAGSAEGETTRGGTPGYMAPEQIAGEPATERSDIYALGLVLFEMFAGRRPFEASTFAAMHSKQKQGAPSITSNVKDVDPAVDRVIVRCLDPDPLKRPTSALAVAAALPGGDPLAAALEAGETPSPEMVAASGGRDAMKPWLAVACLAALIAGFAAETWLQGKSYLDVAVPSELGPEALAQQARTILAALGYPKPAAQEWNFARDAALIGAMQGMDRKTALARAADARPPAIYFWYRTAPERMTTWRFNAPVVAEDDPPHVQPGAVALRLDTAGRLCRLDAIPPDHDDGPPSAQLQPEAVWKKLFDAAGLDPARFAPAAPVETPPMSFDVRAAWVESGPESAASHPLRVEAAAWRGRAVWFSLARGQAPAQPPSSAAWGAINLVAFLIAAVWGWRNVRSGRADLRVALSLGAIVFAITFAADCLALRHGFDAAEFERLTMSLADELFWGVFLTAMYLALEPYVRRRWPQALIGWTRLWSGRLRDPLVGRHVLTGFAVGAWMGFVLVGVNIATGRLLAAPLADVRNAGMVAASLGYLSANPVYYSCFVLMAVALLSRVLKNRWISALLLVLIFSGANWLSSGDWRVFFANFLAWSALFALVLRLGLLAAAAGFWVLFLTDLPVTLDTSAWFFYATPIVFAVALGVGAWAFFTALGGQKLLAEE
jgi:serine/threonine-protein kinase